MKTLLARRVSNEKPKMSEKKLPMATFEMIGAHVYATLSKCPVSSRIRVACA